MYVNYQFQFIIKGKFPNVLTTYKDPKMRIYEVAVRVIYYKIFKQDVEEREKVETREKGIKIWVIKTYSDKYYRVFWRYLQAVIKSVIQIRKIHLCNYFYSTHIFLRIFVCVFFKCQKNGILYLKITLAAMTIVHFCAM